MANTITVTGPDISVFDYGVASNSTETFAAVSDLVTGSQAPITYADYRVKAGTVIAKLAPVALDADKFLIPAVMGTPAVGISPADLAPTDEIMVNILVGGCFNPDRLAWDASYTTDEQKRLAFVGAPTPTNILIRKRETYAATSNI